MQKDRNQQPFFFHPDYTVGSGVSPDHALRLAGYTAGRELHPALKSAFVFVASIKTRLSFANRKFTSQSPGRIQMTAA
jgi:hypothetical protein